MEDKQLNEKESLELIAQMIRNTQQKLKKDNGIPFLIWGYTTIVVSLAVWYMLTSTGNYMWNLLWMAIPIIGYPTMMLSLKNESSHPKTYIDKIISYVWIVIGVSAFIPPLSSVFMHNFPILFLVVLLISIGTTITGLVVKFSPLSIAGFIGIFLSLFCLVLHDKAESILVFAALFFIVQVIPGHILYYKGRKENV